MNQFKLWARKHSSVNPPRELVKIDPIPNTIHGKRGKTDAKRGKTDGDLQNEKLGKNWTVFLRICFKKPQIDFFKPICEQKGSSDQFGLFS